MGFKEMRNGTVTSPKGYVAGTAASGFKKNEKLDLALIFSDLPCSAAGVFTQNQVLAAPVVVDKETLSVNNFHIRAIVANSGSANACTGIQGLNAARQTQQTAASFLACQPEEVLVLSTGVIGLPLSMDKMKRGIATANRNLSADNGLAAAQAIMTTDTKPKHYAISFPENRGMVTIGGIAKGSGMIHPNMATMLSIITTDAAMPAGLLQELLDDAVDKTFNCISVDGDTSTNDTVLLLANGASGVEPNSNASVDVFFQGLTEVCSDLAIKIVRDGEGATKFVEVRVTGATEERQAKRIAETIAVSPLVKTALAGSDPNWGRIIMAAGRAGVTLDPAKLRFSVSNPGTTPMTLVDNGTPTDYDESDAVAIFTQSDLVLELDLGLGAKEAVMWTTDLTHQYVTINADYRT